MSFDSDAWIQFAQDNWMVIAIAIVAIFLIMKLVKTVMKWVLVLVIILGIVTYGGISVDELKEAGTKVSEEIGAIGDKVSTELKEQAIKSMAGEASEATYIDNADGSYSIKSKNFELSGVPNSGEVSVKFKDQSLGTWKMEGAVRDFVKQARASAK
ncbi:hypothetical protein [Cohnella sp. WQ 127256]|uniref:hypothetical protein n=1 Tax=Cohnella sp. WQ 127256 TaxID=2938790 RepID=UPI0021176302|nr:hypothetical protein [Cohnella sp. WQ 127256]